MCKGSWRCAKQAGSGRILTFGASAGSDARLLSVSGSGEGSKVEAEILGRRCDFRIGALGAHLAHNAVGALLSVAALDGDLLNAAAAFASFSALKGRGARFTVAVQGGAATVIDESYNANPTSMNAALALLGSAQPGPAGRRIAVLGDMLEMGPEGEALHAALAHDVELAGTDLVFACGPQMGALWNALPQSRRGAYGGVSGEIAAQVVGALRDGDVVLVKGSLGSRMAVIIDALKAHATAA